MREGSVVSDTSPLLNLALVERLDLLESQFETVTAPEQVWTELAAGEDGLAALRALRSRGSLVVEAVDHDDLFVELARELDLGEAAAIRYAIKNDTDLLLLDEREGRKTARRHGLELTGVVGILLRGAEQGVVDLRLELDRLRSAGFWISDELYAEVLDRGDSGE